MNTIRYEHPEVARAYAIEKHGRQKYGSQPYSFHLDSAVEQLKDHILTLPALRFHNHDILVSATFLHDVIEDTGTSLIQLAATFTGPIVDLVEAVTDGPGKNRKERKFYVYQAIKKVGPAALAVKLADRLANSEACGLAKGESPMLSMYRKEQASFEHQLSCNEMPGFSSVFDRIRANLGMGDDD